MRDSERNCCSLRWLAVLANPSLKVRRNEGFFKRKWLTPSEPVEVWQEYKEGRVGCWPRFLLGTKACSAHA